jgi:hypothetical protein
MSELLLKHRKSCCYHMEELDIKTELEGKEKVVRRKKKESSL